MRLRDALLLLVIVVLVVSILPVGLLLDRRLRSALVEREREELAAAPMILEDRLASVRTVRMMHARDYAVIPEILTALDAGDMEEASRILSDATQGVQEQPVLIDAHGLEILGPGTVPAYLVEATRRGEMPVSVVPFEDGLHLIALAPVESGGTWLGAVGGSTPFAEAEAATLAGLTRSEIVVLDDEREVTASTIATDLSRQVALAAPQPTRSVLELELPSGPVLVTTVTLDHGQIVFLKDLSQELAIVPNLQRTALLSTAGALLFAVLIGAVFAHRLARPVSELAGAANEFEAAGSEVPLRRSSLLEVRHLSEAFTSMRRALAGRLQDLEEANRALEERQARLTAMQAEVVRRERLATSGRLIVQLAHEIRNPVASVRNCLEVVRRQGDLHGDAEEFADMAVGELLRMHELAERMLDLHRPRARDDTTCDAGQVARETAQLVQVGSGQSTGIDVVAPEGLEVRMPHESLKQVLMNLLLNAREAALPDSTVEVLVSRDGVEDDVRIDVLDRGPGIREDILDRVFDPFFTTKESVQGVGLGLYTAEGLVRAQGGRMEAANRVDGPGARFTLYLPAAP